MMRYHASPCTDAAPRRPALRQVVLTLGALLLLSACSLPRIIVLHDPLSSDEHVRLGGIYASKGETAPARDQFRLAVEADKKNGKAWQLLGDVTYQLKEYKEAEEAYRRALDLDPADGDLQNNLAWVYVQENRRLEKARELVEKAMQSKPEHRPYYLDTLGVVLLKTGKPQDAIAALKESADTLPPDQPSAQAEAWLHLSEAYHAAGDEAAAAEALKRSQKLAEHP